jgi:hypothetical protein
LNDVLLSPWAVFDKGTKSRLGRHIEQSTYDSSTITHEIDDTRPSPFMLCAVCLFSKSLSVFASHGDNNHHHRLGYRHHHKYPPTSALNSGLHFSFVTVWNFHLFGWDMHYTAGWVWDGMGWIGKGHVNCIGFSRVIPESYPAQAPLLFFVAMKARERGFPLVRSRIVYSLSEFRWVRMGGNALFRAGRGSEAYKSSPRAGFEGPSSC